MAKEAENNEEENAEGEAPPQPMFSKMGLIVFGGSMGLLVILFSSVIFFIRKPPAEIEEKKEIPPVKNWIDLSAPDIKLTGKNSVTISIPTNVHATEFRHLKVSFTLKLGRVEGEFTPEFNLNEALIAEQFLETSANLMPHIKDLAIELLRGYTYLQLQDETYTTEFKQRLRDKVNDKLKLFGMKPRINEVLLNEFIFSD